MKKNVVSYFLLALLVSFSVLANARGERFYTGVELKLLCASYSKDCLQYIAGVFDGFTMVYAFIDPEKKDYLLPQRHHCPPKGLTTERLRDIVVKYLNDTPQKKHFDANMQVYKAVLKEYPCTIK